MTERIIGVSSLFGSDPSTVATQLFRNKKEEETKSIGTTKKSDNGERSRVERRGGGSRMAVKETVFTQWNYKCIYHSVDRYSAICDIRGARIDKTLGCHHVEPLAVAAAADAPFERIQRQNNYWVCRTLSDCHRCVSFLSYGESKSRYRNFPPNPPVSARVCVCVSERAAVRSTKLILLAFRVEHMCLVSFVCNLLLSSRSSCFFFVSVIGLISRVVCLHFVHCEKFGCVGDNSSICECQPAPANARKWIYTRKINMGYFPFLCSLLAST